MNHPIPYPDTDAEIAANPWMEITEDVFFTYLGAVPPHRRAGTAFAVGEPLCFTDDGGIVDEMCVQVGDKYYCKPERLSKFNPTNFINEIRAQLAKSPACARSACKSALVGSHYAIWNDVTDSPRLYCMGCGKKIIDGNQADELKLRYEIRPLS